MERFDLLDWARLDDVVHCWRARALSQWRHGPVRMGRTRTVFVDVAGAAVYKVERVRGTNVAERCELELLADVAGMVDWVCVDSPVGSVLVCEFVPGPHPERLDPDHPLVAALAEANADLHVANFVVDSRDDALRCVDLGP
jgi:hypothetical protein